MARPSVPFGRLNTATKIAVGVGICALVSVAYFVVFFGDVSSAIASATRQEENLKGELNQAKESQRVYTRDLAELAERQQKQRDLNKILPETADYPSFLSAVQGVANVSGVELLGWAPMDSIKQQFFAKVPMRLSVTGKFHQIAKFFWGIGQLDRIINMENITLADPKVVGDEVRLRVACLATAFHTLAASQNTGTGAKPAAAGAKK